MLQPYERLKAVFDGHIDRLARRFKISYGLAYKWQRDTEDLGTGKANPLQRVRDLIDEAWIVDPTGEGARLIAQDATDYYNSLSVDRTEKINPQDEVTSLITKAAEVVSKLNKPDVDKMGERERKELAENLSAICCAAEKIGLKLAPKQTKARLFELRQGG